MGFVEAGQAGNVIPEKVKFGGTYRSLTTEGLYYLQKRIKEVLVILMHNYRIIIMLINSAYALMLNRNTYYLDINMDQFALLKQIM